jgi:hypothetical protein
LQSFFAHAIARKRKSTHAAPSTLFGLNTRYIQAAPCVGVFPGAKLQFLGQKINFGQNKGLRIRFSPDFLKSGQRKGNAVFVGYPPLPFFAGKGKAFPAFGYMIGSDKNVI